MLCGCFPFKGANDRDLYKKIASASFSIPDHVSPSAKELIRMMIQKEPLSRPTCQEILDQSWLSTPVLSEPWLNYEILNETCKEEVHLEQMSTKETESIKV